MLRTGKNFSVALYPASCCAGVQKRMLLRAGFFAGASAANAAPAVNNANVAIRILRKPMSPFFAARTVSRRRDAVKRRRIGGGDDWCKMKQVRRRPRGN